MRRNVREGIYITVHKLIYNNVVVSYVILMSPCLNKQKDQKRRRKREGRKSEEGRFRKSESDRGGGRVTGIILFS